MNWEAVSAVGEIIGAAAVVATLIYLGIQTSQNTSALRSATSLSMHDKIAQSMMILVNNVGNITEIHLKASNDPESISDVERLRLYSAMDIWFSAWQDLYIQKLLDTSPIDSSGWFQRLSIVFNREIYKIYWRNYNYLYDFRFKTFIDEEIIPLNETTE